MSWLVTVTTTMFWSDIALTVRWLTTLFLLKQQVSLSPQLWQCVSCGTQDITSNRGVQFHKSHQTSHLCKHHHFGNHDDCSCHHNLDENCACADWCFEHLFDKYHTLLSNQMNGWLAEREQCKITITNISLQVRCFFEQLFSAHQTGKEWNETRKCNWVAFMIVNISELENENG